MGAWGKGKEVFPFPHITGIVFSRKGKAELAVLIFVAVFVEG